MPSWSPDQYLIFEEHRTRPCRDLVARMRVDHARTVMDLGCGPGNSTAVLAERWPSARITGLDSSAEMLDQARRRNPLHEWVAGDIAAWSTSAGTEFDVVFSNAALHWVENHAAVYPRLLARVAPGGVFAAQVPANMGEPAHQIMRDLASSRTWRRRFSAAGVREWFVHDPAFYYDVLAPNASSVDIWETTYIQVMPDAESIAEWYKRTGLRPFLDGLSSDGDRDQFLKGSTEALRSVYRPSLDGSVLFPFRVCSSSRID